jgi:hypothetical protein
MTDGFELIDGDAIEGGAGSQGDLIDEPTSRRRLFKMGAVGVAAVGAAAVGNALTAGPAGAATGGNLLIGQANAASSVHDLTTLTGGSGFLASTPEGHIGVEGQALTQTPGSLGVKGTGVIGVQGVTIGGGTIGAVGPGVLGVGNAAGVGVQARNAAGASVLIEPFGTTTLPAASSVGQFIVLSDGSLHYSYAANRWVPLTNGIVPIAPVRVINTVAGTGGITGPLVPGATVHTSSAIAGTNGIPAQAIGVVGNFAISGVSGALLNGFGVATIFPAGAATPATANINAGAGCFAISNSVTVGFGSGGNAGKLAIVWGGGGAVPHAQAFFDVTGYIL